MTDTSKRVILAAAAVVVVLMGFLFLRKERVAVQEGPRLQVAVTTVPLQVFAANIVGDAGEVVNLLEDGVDPRKETLGASGMAEAKDADIIFMNGRGLDDAIFRQLLKDNQSLPIITVADSVDSSLPALLPFDGESYNNAVVQPAPDHLKNPYVWMNPGYAARMVEKMRNELMKKDPSRANVYAVNAEKYLQEVLIPLHAAYREQLWDLRGRQLVTAYPFLDHLTVEFGMSRRLSLTAGPYETLAKAVSDNFVARFKREKPLALFDDAMRATDTVTDIGKRSGIPVRTLNVMLQGMIFSKDAYEKAAKENLETLVSGLEIK